MAGLELAKYRLVLRPLQPLALSEYKGATFRGGFGTVFRRVACACGSGATVHQKRCLYSQVFETPQREDLPALPRTAHLPHPFVLEPPLETQRVYTPADRLTVHLILVGQALEWLPYFVFTFDELGRVGIGQNRGRYQVDEVCSVNGADTSVVFSGRTRRFLGQGQHVTFEELWQPDEAVQAAEVEFLTYTRVMGKGHLRSSVDFPLLFGALLRRIALLMYAHGDGGTLPLPSGRSIDALSIVRYFYDRSAQQPDARQAIRDAYRVAEQVIMARQGLHWEEWERYSTRQETRMKLGGVLGAVCYTGPIGPFLPYLRVGEYIHVGKNTTFGLGQMVVRV
jgi:hypothetical protein